MLALQLAWRFLREGRTQSLLILAGVTIGIAAFVFVSAIIRGPSGQPARANSWEPSTHQRGARGSITARALA